MCACERKRGLRVSVFFFWLLEMPCASESFSSFASALEELLDDLEAEHTGLLSGVAVRRVFSPRTKDHALYPDMLRCIRELEFWNHLKKLLICIDRCSEADKVVQKWGSLVIKIEDVFRQITEELGVVCRNNNNSKVPLEALDDVLHDSEAKIGLFQQETGEALDCLSLLSTCCSLEWSVPLLAFLLKEFLVSISGILESIRRECEHDKEVQVLAFRVEVVTPLLRFLAALIKEDHPIFHGGYQIIHNFLTLVAFVAIRIANQSFHFWINKIVDPVLAKNKIIGLLDLQREIDPLNLQFLEFILKFLRAFVKNNPGRVERAVCSFLHHILNRKWQMDKDFQKKLEPLIIFIINESEEHPREDAQSLVAEIRSMFILVQRYTLNSLLIDLSPLKLERQLCLLKAEVFLEQQLKSISLDSKVELKQLLTGVRTISRQTDQDIEDGKLIFMLYDEVVRDLVSLQHSLNRKKITRDHLRIPLLMLLLKIVIFKAESSFTEFLNANGSIMGLEKDQTNNLLEGLNLFTAFVSNRQQDETQKDVEQILTYIKESSRGVSSLFFLFNVNNNTEEMIKNMMHSFSDLLEKMDLVKAKLRDICPRFPRSNFPRIHGMGFIDFLLENLSELIKHSPHSIALVKHHVERIQLDLKHLRSFPVKLDTENSELRDLGTRVTDAVYEAECVIDSIEVGIGDHWQHLLWFHDLLEEIRLVKLQVAKVYEEKSSDVVAPNITQSSSHTISQVSRPEIGELVVCLSEEEDAIIDRLTRGSSQRDVISIVGMPGIGKTTLANKVYNNSRVTFHFHIRAWCSVSQGYSKRDLLLDILSSTGALTDEMYQMTDEDLDLKLYQRLKSRRYLIVMDDLWDTEAWNALERSFPNDENGSRILMTSRLRDVLLKAKRDSDPHSLRLLSDDESWELLQMRIFHGDCPEELLEVGKVIAKNCKGLPLAVVAITGLLTRTEKKQEKWKIIAESLSSQIFDDPQTRCMDILQLSYNHLPDCLKACFLYFGAFLEDKDISVQKLARLWIAEGFIPKNVVKSLEELAEDYLMDLIGRSLVTVSKRGSRGRVKACRIHDLLRDLCLSKAKEVNFLQVITVSDEPYASFSDLDCGDDFYDYYPSNPVTYQRHRICICLKRKHFVKSSPYGPCTRSLIFFATSDTYPRRPYDISFIPRHFKLLRVLDLENINMGMSFPAGIELLVQLRYLAVSGDIDFIPPSIANLRKLEILIVKGLKDKVILPYVIWSMAKLRHLHVNNYVDFCLQDDKPGNFLPLDNLVSLSSPLLSYGKDAEKIMRRFPNLRKLRCIFLESWDPSRNYNKFPELHFLIQLESLKIMYFGRVLNPSEFTLPWNLKKLTLTNFRLPWIHISAVGRLQNLEVLKLLSRAFEGRRWDMREGEFLKLKYLKLDTLNIAQWNASSDHLPKLQQLVIRNCEDLEEVPNAFGEIPTLLMIEVQSCGRSTEESVLKIGDEGIEGLKIIVNHKSHI